MADLKLKNQLPAASRRSAARRHKRADEEKVPFWNREITITAAFDSKEKLQFFHLLAVLMDSGLSITESLEVILEQTKKRKSKEIVRGIMRALNEGQSLSEAASKREKQFSQFEIFSLKMAERTGQMVRVLQDLAQYHEKRLKLRRQLTQAFSYPLIVMTIAGGVLFFMISFVVPMFRDIFARFDSELPGITKMVISMSEFATQWGHWIFLMIVGITILLLRSRDKLWMRKASGFLFSRMPLFGKVILKVQLSRFCYTLALMLRSRVNMDQAFELMEKIIRFHPLQKTLPAIRKDVVEGKSLFEAVKVHPVFPVMMMQMVRVGEKTARLDAMLENLAKNLEEQGDAEIKTLTRLLEPILIVVLGMMVGLILVAMYLPMFELSNTISA